MTTYLEQVVKAVLEAAFQAALRNDNACPDLETDTDYDAVIASVPVPDPIFYYHEAHGTAVIERAEDVDASTLAEGGYLRLPLWGQAVDTIEPLNAQLLQAARAATSKEPMFNSDNIETLRLLVERIDSIPESEGQSEGVFLKNCTFSSGGFPEELVWPKLLGSAVQGSEKGEKS